jgi:hypothetical protein
VWMIPWDVAVTGKIQSRCDGVGSEVMFLNPPLQPGPSIGHFYLARLGHYHLALTRGRSVIDSLHLTMEDSFKRRRPPFKNLHGWNYDGRTGHEFRLIS